MRNYFSVQVTDALPKSLCLFSLSLGSKERDLFWNIPRMKYQAGRVVAHCHPGGLLPSRLVADGRPSLLGFAPRLRA